MTLSGADLFLPYEIRGSLRVGAISPSLSLSPPCPVWCRERMLHRYLWNETRRYQTVGQATVSLWASVSSSLKWGDSGAVAKMGQEGRCEMLCQLWEIWQIPNVSTEETHSLVLRA